MNHPIVVVAVVLLLRKLGFSIFFKDASITFVFSDYRWNESWMKNDPTVVVVVLLRKPGSLRKRGRYCKPTKTDRGPLSFFSRREKASSQFHKEGGSVHGISGHLVRSKPAKSRL